MSKIIFKHKNTKDVIKHCFCNWSNLLLGRVDFKYENIRDIILPNDPELFQKIKDKYLWGCRLPFDVVKEIHLYNLDGVGINLIRHSNILTKSQHSLLKLKYPSQIGENIKLPNYEDCVEDLHEEAAITSEFDF